jgi:hypothetical protein
MYKWQSDNKQKGQQSDGRFKVDCLFEFNEQEKTTQYYDIWVVTGIPIGGKSQPQTTETTATLATGNKNKTNKLEEAINMQGPLFRGLLIFNFCLSNIFSNSRC